MALLFCDGFDYVDRSGLNKAYDGFNDDIDDWDTDTGTKRTGSRSLKVADSDHEYMLKFFPWDADS